MTMKRGREDEEEVETAAMANCLMLLSRVGKTQLPPGRVFECKTCYRQFPSFQALGGHRASHKKPRLTATGFNSKVHPPPKPKTHECSVCGLEFAVGQALGGHMRRHRSVMKEGSLRKLMGRVPIMKKSSSKRVLCLDLNLTPYENDLKLGMGNPMMESFI